MEEQAFLILKNLLLRSEILTPEEVPIIIKECNNLTFYPDYRKRCNVRSEGVNNFMHYNCNNLGSAIDQMFTWQHTDSKHLFWSEIKYRLDEKYP